MSDSSTDMSVLNFVVRISLEDHSVECRKRLHKAAEKFLAFVEDPMYRSVAYDLEGAVRDAWKGHYEPPCKEKTK